MFSLLVINAGTVAACWFLQVLYVIHYYQLKHLAVAQRFLFVALLCERKRASL
jgi:hypothetical protein